MEKKFEKPELIIISFGEDDIVTTSGVGTRFGANGDEWDGTEEI